MKTCPGYGINLNQRRLFTWAEQTKQGLGRVLSQYNLCADISNFVPASNAPNKGDKIS